MILQAICRGRGNFVAVNPASTPRVDRGMVGLHVTEGVGGRWHYHLSKPGINGRGLCGAKTMYTAVPLSTWGMKGHLNESYCDACAQAGAQDLAAA